MLNAPKNSNSDKTKSTMPKMLLTLLTLLPEDAKMLWLLPKLIWKRLTTTSPASNKSLLVWLLKDLLNTMLTKIWSTTNSNLPSMPSKVLTPSWVTSLPKLFPSSNSPTTSTRCSSRWSRLTRLTPSLLSSPSYSLNLTSNTELAVMLLINFRLYSNN